MKLYKKIDSEILDGLQISKLVIEKSLVKIYLEQNEFYARSILLALNCIFKFENSEYKYKKIGSMKIDGERRRVGIKDLTINGIIYTLEH